MRAAGKAFNQMLEAAGAGIQSMPSSEIYTGLQTGVLTGANTSSGSFVSYKIYEQVNEIRTRTEVPIALMGYYNPILKMGHELFLDRCVSSGVDGLILPDLPLDEAKIFCELAK